MVDELSNLSLQLNNLNVGQYLDMFVEHGIKSVEDLKGVSNDVLRILGVKPFHIVKIRRITNPEQTKPRQDFTL